MQRPFRLLAVLGLVTVLLPVAAQQGNPKFQARVAKIRLPQAHSGTVLDPKDKDILSLHLDREGKWIVPDAKSFQELETEAEIKYHLVSEYIKAKKVAVGGNVKTAILIRADRDVAFLPLAKLCRAAKDAGFPQIDLAVALREGNKTGRLTVGGRDWRRPETLAEITVIVWAVSYGEKEGNISDIWVDGPTREPVAIPNLEALEKHLLATRAKLQNQDAIVISTQNGLKQGPLTNVMDVCLQAKFRSCIFNELSPEPAGGQAPDANTQAKAEAEIKTLFQKDYAATERKELISLAKKLGWAAEVCDDSAARFVLLREKATLSARGGEVSTAMNTIERMADDFDVNPLLFREAALKLAPVSEGKAVADHALQLARGALIQDQPEVAGRFLKLAEAAAEKTGDKALLTGVLARRDAIEASRKQAERLENVRKQPTKNQTLAEANLLLGKHLCLEKGNWEEGLPMLARSGDPALEPLAKKQLAQPADTAGLLALADGWWDLATKSNDLEKRNLQLNGRRWYRLALPMLPKDAPLDRQRAEQRLQETDRLVGLFPGGWGNRPDGWGSRGREPAIGNARPQPGEEGFNARSEAAVAAGLKWMVRHQAIDGHWGMHDFHVHGKCNCADPGRRYDVAGTSFGLLPLLAAGETHTGTGKNHLYAKNVERGLKWLMVRQRADGSFSGNGYEHALATLAVCEAYAMTADPMLREPAQSAIDACVAWQHEAGGFRYSPRQPGDSSVTGWFVQALVAGRNTGLKVPDATFTNIHKFLDSVGNAEGSAYGYMKPDPVPTATATGLLSRQMLGWDAKKPGIVKGLEYLQKLPPSPNFKNIYHYYYATQFVRNMATAKPEAWDPKTSGKVTFNDLTTGKSVTVTVFDGWNPKMRDLLVDSQDQGQNADRRDHKGSWSPEVDAWGEHLGRLGYSSLALLTLEVYYRQMPLYSAKK